MYDEKVHAFLAYDETNKLRANGWTEIVMQYSIKDNVAMTIEVDDESPFVLGCDKATRTLHKEDILNLIGLKAYKLITSNSMITYIKNNISKQIIMICSYDLTKKEIKDIKPSEISNYWLETDKVIVHILKGGDRIWQH